MLYFPWGLAYAEKDGGRSHSQVLRDPLRIRGTAAQSTQNYLKTRPDPAPCAGRARTLRKAAQTPSQAQHPRQSPGRDPRTIPTTSGNDSQGLLSNFSAFGAVFS